MVEQSKKDNNTQNWRPFENLLKELEEWEKKEGVQVVRGEFKGVHVTLNPSPEFVKRRREYLGKR